MLKRFMDPLEKIDAKRFCASDREPTATDENAYTAIRSRASSTSTLSMMDVDQEEDMDENLPCSDPCQVMGVENEMLERDGDPNEVVLSVITGKRPRYTRKIDALVDDLIRKTNRTLDWNNQRSTGSGNVPPSFSGSGSSSSAGGACYNGGFDLFLPEIRTPGPHPGSDQRLLGKVRNREDDTLSLVLFRDWDGKDDQQKVSSNSVNAPTAAGTRADSTSSRNTHSGNISHSDWPIEELA